MNALTDSELDRLAAVLVAAGEHVDGALCATLIAGGRSNLTYRLTDGDRAWALRRPPRGAVIESAHDMAREYRVVAGLRDTSVPVARAVALDDGQALGAPCAVFEFVEGRTVRSRDDLTGWTRDDFSACASALVDVLAELHAVDPTAVGLADHGRPGAYNARQLARWQRQWEQIGGADSRAGRLHDRLVHLLPDQEATSVVHGDYRVDNVLLATDDPGHVVAVVDWELSTLGDPSADVALMCAYRHAALDGILGIPAAWASDAFPSAESLWSAYQERSGRTLRDTAFHLGLAYYKIAVIAAGISYRHQQGVTAGSGYDGVAATVPVLLEAGLEAVARD